MPKEIIAGFRLAPPQEHLWRQQRGERTQPYRVQCAILIEGNLKTKALRTALQNVVARHEILRVTFRLLPGMDLPLQVITPSRITWGQDHDLSSLASRAQEAELEVLFDALRQVPFDFEQGPLLHASLSTLSPHQHMLHVCLPALSADTTGLKNLVCELSHAYAACVSDEALSADAPMQYVLVSEWLHELLASEEAAEGREYWRKQYSADLLTVKLPFERQPAGHPGFAPQWLSWELHPETVARITTLVQQYDTSVSVFLLACWQVLLGRRIGQADIIVGTAYDGRSWKQRLGC
jgi:hypothetical protein